MKKENHNAVPDSVLTKDFLSQFKTEDDVSKFLSKLHSQVLEKMLEGEMDVHLGYEKNLVVGNTAATHARQVSLCHTVLVQEQGRPRRILPVPS